MKILLLNPHIDAQHKIAQVLRARGMALLMPSSADEAVQVLKLHGPSVDLAVIHREGVQGGDPGVELVSKIKKDPAQADLPILFTTESWSPEQCASHQQTPMGANAYLHWPFDETALLKTVDAIFGAESPSGGAPVPEAPATGTSIEVIEHPRVEPPKSGEFVLEDPSGIFDKAGPRETSIRLEAPEAVPVAPASGSGSGIELSSLSESASVESSARSENAPAGQPANQSATPLSSIEISLPIEASAMSPAADVPAGGAQDAEPAGGLAIEMSAIAMTSQTDSPEPASGVPPETNDSELEREMPYLFSKSGSAVAIEPGAFARAFVQPVGDAVIPGGAASAPDTETLKKYLMLREQDVAALSSQLKAARDELAATRKDLAGERARAEDLQFRADDQARKIDDFEREKALALEGIQAELEELRFQAKAKADKAKLLETQVSEAATEIERLKERVRSDIRKIRVRERELENKLEISKKDSEAILAARENKIIELKRKLDLLEFNMDLLQDRHAREKETSARLREKLAKAAQVVRVAEGLLDTEPGATEANQGAAESKVS